MRDSAIERFWKKTRIGSNGCLEWIAYKARNGYGLVTVGPRGKQRKIPAHRWIYEQALGPLPRWPHRVVAHSCDNKICVALQHLEATSQRANILDAAGKDRLSLKRRISDEVIAAIKAERDLTQRQIAKKYGVSQPYVSSLRRGGRSL